VYDGCFVSTVLEKVIATVLRRARERVVETSRLSPAMVCVVVAQVVMGIVRASCALSICS